MQQPEGYDDGSGRVCKLNKSLYGLKQSSRNWNLKFSEFLQSQGFKATPEDQCVFVRKTDTHPTGNRQQNILIVCLYVDDGLICGSDAKAVTVFINKLTQAFEVTVNEPNCYVGMELEVNQVDRCIKVSQKGYISRMLQRFGMSEAKPISTPMDPSSRLVIEDSKDAFSCPYREAIGCLNYLSQISRPDITFAVNRLAKYCNLPQIVHWNAVKRVIRYLKHTESYSLMLGNDRTDGLTGHCDSDWGGDPHEFKSTSGYIFTFKGGPVAWTSRLQDVTAFSSSEAEYMALAEALKESLWLRPFLKSIGQPSEDPTTIFVDNRAAIAMSRNAEFHKRTKHVGIKYHRVRQEQQAGTVYVEFVPSERNPADMLTKAVDAVTLTRNIDLVNIF